ncbi:protein containing Clp ATPase, partial [Candidatus Magnetomorum sp. HK-1]
SQGKKVNFKNSIIIATSNAGADFIYSQQKEIKNQKFIDHLTKNVRNDEGKPIFDNAFLNRFVPVVFNTLDNNVCKEILDLELKARSKQFEKANDIILEISDPVKEYLLSCGFNKKFGARPLKRSIEKNFLSPLAEYILKNKIEGYQKIECYIDKQTISFKNVLS